MRGPGSDIALRLISGGWWGLTLGLLLGGGWNAMLAVFSLVYAVCMAGVAVLGWESPAQPPGGSRRRAFTLGWLAAGSGALVVLAAMNGAPPAWVVAGAAFPLAAALVGVVELARPARRL